MPFSRISRQSLEVLNQNLRSPGVAPGPMPSGQGDAAATEDPSYFVADELLRVISFLPADEDGKPFARQYQVRVAGTIFEPPFTARPAGTPWTSGTTTGFGEELEPVGTRFKKISTLVRTDELMMTGVEDDVLTVQLGLAKIAILRSLSEALLHSAPANDDAAELAGLPFYLPANSSQDVRYDPARGMIGGLAEIEARCKPGEDGLGACPDAFVMSSRSRWRLLKELEDKGVTPDFRWCAFTERVQLHFHGVPVLIGRVPEPADPAAPRTEAWALKLFGPSGVRILHISGDEFGIRTEPVTTVTTVDAQGEATTATRGIEVFGVYSVLVPDRAAIARLRDIPARDPFIQP